MSHVAVIGGGFSGIAVATQLLRMPCGTTGSLSRLTIVEPRDTLGQGIAYSTRDTSHLLNVPAAGMSLFPDQPDDFLNWLAGANRPTPPYGFVERCLYGSYLRHRLAEASSTAATKVSWLESGAAGLERTESGYVVTLAGGASFGADQVVLATGNQPGAWPRLLGGGTMPDDRRAIIDPWGPDGLEALDPERPVLLLGTGLTMVDAALALDDVPWRAPVLAISRRGLAPLGHAPSRITPESRERAEWPARLSELLRVMRRRAQEAMARGDTWRIVVDGLRPHTQSLWQGLTDVEKRRFMRHLRPYWDVHRHRIAPEIAARIEVMTREGRLQVSRGRLVAVEVAADGLTVTIARPDGRREAVTVGGIVNCTGAEGAVTANPLLANLLAAGMAAGDPVKLGLGVDAQDQLLDADGTPADGIHVVGPPTKGRYWEITAVPDIRGQAARVAAGVAEALDAARRSPFEPPALEPGAAIR